MLRALCAAICVGLALAGNAWAGEPVKMWQSYVDGESSFDSFKTWFIERDCADQQAVKTACLSEVAYDKARQLGHFSFIPNDFWGKGDTASPEGLKFVELYIDRFREINRLSGETISYTGFLDLGKNYGFILVPESDLPVLQQAVTSALAIDRLKKEIETATVHAVELRYTNLLEAQEKRFDQILAGLTERVSAVESAVKTAQTTAERAEGKADAAINTADNAAADAAAAKAKAEQAAKDAAEAKAFVDGVRSFLNTMFGWTRKPLIVLAVLVVVTTFLVFFILRGNKKTQRDMARKAKARKDLSDRIGDLNLEGSVDEIKNSARKKTAADATAGEAQTSSDAGEVRQTTTPANTDRDSVPELETRYVSDQGEVLGWDKLLGELHDLEVGDSFKRFFIPAGRTKKVGLEFTRLPDSKRGPGVEIAGIRRLRKQRVKLDSVEPVLKGTPNQDWEGVSFFPRAVA